MMWTPQEHDACGVGFVASLRIESSHENLVLGLRALENLEHRGGTSADFQAGDGTGILTDIPHELLGVREGDAVANLFLPRDPTLRVRSLQIFEETFRNTGLEISRYREVPIDVSVLPDWLAKGRPDFMMAFITRPAQCTSRNTFEKMLYTAKQLTRSRLRAAGIVKQFFFTSLSAGTIVYKALLPAKKLADFYPDLRDKRFRTRFALFHRRFSTNTAPAWDTVQPFRVVAHNGEINTISGNRAWAFARERDLGLKVDELLTHIGISDSGSVNEMIEALMFRSSIPHPEDILAILMPPANDGEPYYSFWGRAMEAWDGPALFTFSDGRVVGARLDRNGFRPCRWLRTEDKFFLSSEAGSFEIPEEEILEKGNLLGGGSVRINLRSGELDFCDPSRSRENRHATFDPRLTKLERLPCPADHLPHAELKELFNYTEEDLTRVLLPMIKDGKEGIGSMGDTARLPLFSSETRSLFDFFYQDFAQVTNPPLDYLRERFVTDMRTLIGRRPNIFEPKELLPLKSGIEIEGPVVTLGQMAFLKSLNTVTGYEGPWPGSCLFDMTFKAKGGKASFEEAIARVQEKAVEAVRRKSSVLILSDRLASWQTPAIPAVLYLSAVVQALNQAGLRLRTGIVVDTGQVKSAHDLAVLVAFGAAAVCPFGPLEIARAMDSDGTADHRELRVASALEAGLLKVMSKMGISAVRSYQASELFTILGLGEDIHRQFFPRHKSPIGGLSLERLITQVLKNASTEPMTADRAPNGLLDNHLYKEHPREKIGEKHSMTIARTKLVHKLTAAVDGKSQTAYEDFAKAGDAQSPISIRHLLRVKDASRSVREDAVQPRSEILRRFGSGAMSFGAISGEAQRDIILAMREVGGRSNSGEGGENPYYWTEGVTASVKQVASGRFGVTAEYLMSGNEIQIKICQGAKPGEGGQLMAVKVSSDIARARHSDTNVDLISPPPMHDIYSIEDLKQLIHEFHSLRPGFPVSVKLVSGANIGTIAVGVAKAGADIIHISGHDGGTGAAPLSSMKHAGLPWELGIVEAHRALVDQGIRENVILRVDGGLSTGRDVVIAALLGAEEFDFGKLLLVAEGCIMARVCEKNTCPTGIATHDPKFKRLYRGSKQKIIRLLEQIAEDVRRQLSRCGAESLESIVGRSELLEIDPRHASLIQERGITLRPLLGSAAPLRFQKKNPFIEPISSLNERIVADVAGGKNSLSYSIKPSDRAVPSTLAGKAAGDRNLRASLTFSGSAGQGFGVFLTEGMSVRLEGEANDSVGKSMSGGRIVVVPSTKSSIDPVKNTILGNCALYGATGGTLFAKGIVGNRFAVRNSGAIAVVEGVGMHACEYMTRGKVVILGQAGRNLGAGMTGGTIYLRRGFETQWNVDYVQSASLAEVDAAELREILELYLLETGSESARTLLSDWQKGRQEFTKVVPRAVKPGQRTPKEPSLVAAIPPVYLPASDSPNAPLEPLPELSPTTAG